MFVGDNSTVTVEGGSITATANSAPGDPGGYGILNENSQVTITGGKVTGTNTGEGDGFGVQAQNGNAKIIISGGTVTGTSSTAMGVGADAEQGNVTITGGTVTGNATDKAYGVYARYTGSKINVSGGYINGSVDQDNGQCELSGGYYTAEPPEEYIVAGLEAVKCKKTKSGVTYHWKIGSPPPPKTGDSTPVFLFSILAVLSIAGLPIVGRKTRKER